MKSIKHYCLILRLFAIVYSCGIAFGDIAKDDLRHEEFKDLSSNVKIGKSVFKICDKIVIHHSLYGDIEFKGQQLKLLVDKLNKLTFDEWWTKGFLTKGKSEWVVMIECFVKKDGFEDKYETILLFPLNSTVLKDADNRVIDELLPPDFVKKALRGNR